jgi:hypothetical protein
MKANIADCLRRIFTSEDLRTSQITVIKDLFDKELTREYFAKALYQKNFDEHKHILLSNTSFANISEMVNHSLKASENKKEEFESIKLLTKSVFYIYK